MTSTEQLKEKLKSKLRELFQFENEDLDFGIYKIINYKRNEIEKFIERELIETIQKQLQVAGENEKQKLLAELQEIEREIRNAFGENAIKNGELEEPFRSTPLGKRYLTKKKQLENIKVSEDLEREIYNHLINFFSRYYDNGDFISKRRYGKNERYVVPYNGEEVYFYWANNDQYYIKTTEYFMKYSFKVNGGLKINFRIISAEEEKGNVKPQDKKFFVLSEKVYDYDPEKNEINIYFEYRGLTDKEKEKYGTRNIQEKINEEILNVLKKHLGEKFKSLFRVEDEKREDYRKYLLGKHIYRYTKRNTTDYFIHKRLKEFLERELDFYIKNEMLKLEDLAILERDEYLESLRSYLVAVRVFRNIALKIIEFLSQIEEFQKKVWEKKKFVLDTHYVITLDKIKEYAGEEFLEGILDEILKNTKQLKEWEELFGINVQDKSDLLVSKPNDDLTKYLKKDGKEEKLWKKLPVDTRYFSEEFKWKLLVALTENHDLDDILDGVLIKSENWQALNLLLNKYREKIDTIYIDPPYNTGNDGFLYKDTYQHSSWLTMMENRLTLAKDLLSNKGTLFISIDDNEYTNLNELAKRIFEYLGTFIVKAKIGGGNDNKYVVPEHEYIQFYAKNSKALDYMWAVPDEEYLGAFRYEDEKGKYYLDSLEKKGIDTNRPNLRYPIKAPDGSEIWPKTIWRLSKEEFERRLKNNEIVFKKDPSTGQWKIYTKTYYRGKVRPRSIILKKGATREGNRDIEALFGARIYTYPKPVKLIEYIVGIDDKIEGNKKKIILDFFAGSGTTAHAVMKLNKEDGGRRKFILVEMADYFDTIIIPRIKKVAYSLNWKDGKPQDMDGPGVFFKYHTLEQYEDALENIEFKEVQKKLYEFPDYVIKYMLNWETKDSLTFLNIDEMKNPFQYKLKIIQGYQQELANVDLIETFNYLLGLKVNKYRVFNKNGRRYVMVFGEKEGKKVAVIWRPLKDIDPNEDRKIIEEHVKDYNPDIVYINGDASMDTEFMPIEPVFKSLLHGG